MHWLTEIGQALRMGAMMGWQMLWALILGFALSAVVQATVSREKVAKLMMSFHWDHTAVLNFVFLAIAAVLLWRFFRSGDAGMLRHMNEPMDGGGGHEHGGVVAHGHHH